MSNICRKKREVFGNITNTDDAFDPMDSEILNGMSETEVKGIDFIPPAGVLDPGISTNSAGLQNEQENSLSRNSPFSLHQSFTKADALKNCGNWLDNQPCHMQDKEVDCRPKRKRRRASLHEDECDSPDENDNTDSVVSSTYDNGHKRKTIKLKDEQLELQCEWRNCDYFTSNLDNFVRHVSLHIPYLEVKMNEDEEGVYVCLWEACGFESADSKEIVRHVNFHSYHTKIKCIGSNMLARSRLPVGAPMEQILDSMKANQDLQVSSERMCQSLCACTYDPDGKNLLPDLPDVLVCGWNECDQNFNNSQMFFYHVLSHVHCNPRGRNVTGGVPCGWRGCKSVFRSIYKLGDHVRSHTQEKLVGCPTCGGLFASKTKFFDHCKRQVPLELQGYQCSHCCKYYPSERLLRDHMRHHVNHYKCSFCDMTCPTPSSLSVHIRYRHLDSKPFKCDFCDYTAKTQYDMKHHLNTHCSDSLYHCDEDGCGFSCRSAYGLGRHYRRCHHGDNEPMYCCHICDGRFQRGSLLTRHLFTQHSFSWPSGHCRFRYKHDEDGFFRLQTVRYESLEVTQEMMQSESGTNQPVCGSSRYNLRRVSGKNEIEITVSEGEDDPQEQMVEGNRILISIEELDTSGNVVRSKMMQADEVPTLPPGTATVIQDGSQIE